MLSGIERGVWVTRFHYVNIVHAKRGILTGMTKDGTFLIEDGRITRPIRNLRFTQSIPEAFSAIEAIGSETRLVAAEYSGINARVPGAADREVRLHRSHRRGGAGLAVAAVDLRIGDRIALRKAHPCGSHEWRVTRLGADIGLVCEGCGASDPDGSPRRRAPLHRPPRARPAGAPDRWPTSSCRRTSSCRPICRSSQPSGERSSRTDRSSLLWIAQVLSQLASNMVLAGLMATVVLATGSNTANAVLILTFLVPAVAFSAIAGVLVERSDARLIMLASNLLRAGGIVLFLLVGSNVALIFVINLLVATVTAFFVPAELTAIPRLVDRRQLMAANSTFVLTINATFAIGFGFLGPLLLTTAGVNAVYVVVAVMFGLAALAIVPLPAVKPEKHAGDRRQGDRAGADRGLRPAERGDRLRAQPSARSRGRWPTSGIAASLIAVMGAIGPGFATDILLLRPQDFFFVMGPAGLGAVMGILFLNAYGRNDPAAAPDRHRAGGDGRDPHRPRAGEADHRLRVARAAADRAQPAGGPQPAPVADRPGGGDRASRRASSTRSSPSRPRPRCRRTCRSRSAARIFGILNTLLSVASFLPVLVGAGGRRPPEHRLPGRRHPGRDGRPGTHHPLAGHRLVATQRGSGPAPGRPPRGQAPDPTAPMTTRVLAAAILVASARSSPGWRSPSPSWRAPCRPPSPSRWCTWPISRCAGYQAMRDAATRRTARRTGAPLGHALVAARNEAPVIAATLAAPRRPGLRRRTGERTLRHRASSTTARPTRPARWRRPAAAVARGPAARRAP